MNDYSNYIKSAIEILPSGAFLTTKNSDKINTMTIGWGNFGFIWGMPVFEALVRESRFTKELIELNNEFTVTFPYGSEQKNALAFCGTKSGREVDKIKECSLELLPAREISTPVVKCHGIAVECRVLMSVDMKDGVVSDEILSKWYKNGDLHTLYYAKIENIYEI